MVCRGPFIGRKECIWDLLLKIDDFPTSILGAKPLWGHDFLNFLIPKKCPLYGHFTGVEKNFIRHFEVCEHIELERSASDHVMETLGGGIEILLQNREFWKSTLGVK